MSTYKKNIERERESTYQVEIKGFRVIFEDRVFTVCERKNNTVEKPRYYLYDTVNKYYLSSLYPTSEPNRYFFDVRGDGKFLITFYPDSTYKIEEL